MSSKGAKDSFRRSLTEYILQLQKKNDWKSCLSLFKGCAETDKDLTFLPYETLIPFLATEHGQWEAVLTLSTKMLPSPPRASVQGGVKENMSTTPDNAIATSAAAKGKRHRLSDDAAFLNAILNAKAATARETAATPAVPPTADDGGQRAAKERVGHNTNARLTEMSTYFADVGQRSYKKRSLSKKKAAEQAEGHSNAAAQEKAVSSLLTVLLEAAMADAAVAEGGSAPFLVQRLKDAFSCNANLPVPTLQKCEATLARWLAAPFLFTKGEDVSARRDASPLEDMGALLDVVRAVLRVRVGRAAAAANVDTPSTTPSAEQEMEKEAAAPSTAIVTLDDSVLQKLEDIHLYVSQRARAHTRTGPGPSADPYVVHLTASLEEYIQRQSRTADGPSAHVALHCCVYTVWDCAIRALTNNRCSLPRSDFSDGTDADGFFVGPEAALIACVILGGVLSRLSPSVRHSYGTVHLALSGTLLLEYALLSRTRRTLASSLQLLVSVKGKARTADTVLAALYESTCQLINSAKVGDETTHVKDADAFLRAGLELILERSGPADTGLTAAPQVNDKKETIYASCTPLLRQIVVALARLIVHNYAAGQRQQSGEAGDSVKREKAGALGAAAVGAPSVSEARLITLLLLNVENTPPKGEPDRNAAQRSVLSAFIRDTLDLANQQPRREARGVCRLLLRVLVSVSEKVETGNIAPLLLSSAEVNHVARRLAPSSERKTAPQVSARSKGLQVAHLLAQSENFASQYTTLLCGLEPFLDDGDCWTFFQTLVRTNIKDERAAKQIARELVELRLGRSHRGVKEKKKERELDARHASALRFYIKALPPPLALAAMLHLLDDDYPADRAPHAAARREALRFLEKVSVICVALLQDTRINLSIQEKNAKARRLLNVPLATAEGEVEDERARVAPEADKSGAMARRALLLWRESPHGLSQQSEVARLMEKVLMVESGLVGEEAVSDGGDGGDGGGPGSRIPSAEGAEKKWLASNAAVDTILYTLVVKTSPSHWADALAIVREGVPMGDRYLAEGADGEEANTPLTTLLRVTSRRGRPLSKEEHETLVDKIKPLLYKRNTNAAIGLFYAYERDGRRLTLSELELFAAAGVSRGPMPFAERLIVYAQGCPSSVRISTSVIRCAAQHYARRGRAHKKESGKWSAPRKAGSEGVTDRLLLRHRCQVLALRGARLLPKVTSTDEGATATHLPATVSQQKMTKEDVAVVKKCFLILTDHNMKEARELAAEAGLFESTAVAEGVEALESTVALCADAGDFRSGVNAYMKFREDYMCPLVGHELLQRLIRMELQWQRGQQVEETHAPVQSHEREAAPTSTPEANDVTTAFADKNRKKSKRSHKQKLHVLDGKASASTQQALQLLIQDGYRALVKLGAKPQWRRLGTEPAQGGAEEGEGKSEKSHVLRFFEDTLASIFAVDVAGDERRTAAAVRARGEDTPLADFLQRDGAGLFRALLKPFLSLPHAGRLPLQAVTVCVRFLREMSVVVSDEMQQQHAQGRGGEEAPLQLLEELLRTAQEFVADIDDLRGAGAKPESGPAGGADLEQHRIDVLWLRIIEKNLTHQRRLRTAVSHDALDQLVMETESSELKSIKSVLQSHASAFAGEDHDATLSYEVISEMHRVISFVFRCGLTKNAPASGWRCRPLPANKNKSSAVKTTRDAYRVSSLSALAAAAEVSASIWQRQKCPTAPRATAAVGSNKGDHALSGSNLTPRELDAYFQATHTTLLITKDFFDLYQSYELRLACPGGSACKDSGTFFAVRASLTALRTAATVALERFQQSVWLPFWLETAPSLRWMRVGRPHDRYSLRAQGNEPEEVVGESVWQAVFASGEWRRRWLEQHALLVLCRVYGQHHRRLDAASSSVLLLLQRAERAMLEEGPTALSEKAQRQAREHDKMLVATALFLCDDSSLSCDSYLQVHGGAVRALLLRVADIAEPDSVALPLSRHLGELVCGLLFANPRLKLPALHQLLALDGADSASGDGDGRSLWVALWSAGMRWCSDVPAFIREHILSHQSGDGTYATIEELLSHISNNWNSVFWTGFSDEEEELTQQLLSTSGLIVGKGMHLRERSVFTLLFLWHHFPIAADVVGCNSTTAKRRAQVVEESVEHAVQLIALTMPERRDLVDLVITHAPVYGGGPGGGGEEEEENKAASDVIAARLLNALQNILLWPPAKLLTWASILTQHYGAAHDEKKSEEVHKLLGVLIRETLFTIPHAEASSPQRALIEQDVLSVERARRTHSIGALANMHDYECKQDRAACVARALVRCLNGQSEKGNPAALFREMDCSVQLHFLLQIKRGGSRVRWTPQQMAAFFALADPSVRHLCLLDRLPFLKDMSSDVHYDASAIAQVWQSPASVRWSSRRDRYVVAAETHGPQVKQGGSELEGTTLAFPGALFSTYHAFQHLLGGHVKTEQHQKEILMAERTAARINEKLARLLRLPPPHSADNTFPSSNARSDFNLDTMHLPKLLTLRPGDAAFTAVQVLCQALCSTSTHDGSSNVFGGLNARFAAADAAVQRLAWGCATARSTLELAALFTEEDANGVSPPGTTSASPEAFQLLWNVTLHRLVELGRYETVVKQGEAAFQQNELCVVIAFLGHVERCGAAGLCSIQKEVLLYTICLLLREVAPHAIAVDAPTGATLKTKSEQEPRHAQQKVKACLEKVSGGGNGKKSPVDAPQTLRDVLTPEHLPAWLEAVASIQESIVCTSGERDADSASGLPSSSSPFAWKHSPWPPLLLEERLFSRFQTQWEIFFSNPSRQLLPPGTICFGHPTMVCRVIDALRNGLHNTESKVGGGGERAGSRLVALQHAQTFTRAPGGGGEHKKVHPLLQMANATKEYATRHVATFAASHPSMRRLAEEVRVSSLSAAAVRRVVTGEGEEAGEEKGDGSCGGCSLGVGGGGGSALVLDHLIRVLRASNSDAAGMSPEFVSVTRGLMRDVFGYSSSATGKTESAHLYNGYVPLEWNHLLHLFIARVGFEKQKTAVAEHVEMVLEKINDMIECEKWLLLQRSAKGLEGATRSAHTQEAARITFLRKSLLAKKDVQQLLCFFLKSHHAALTFVNPYGWHAQRSAVVHTTYTCLLEFIYQLQSLEARGGTISVNYWSPNVQNHLEKLFVLSGSGSGDGKDGRALASRSDGSHSASHQSIPMALLSLSSPSKTRQNAGEVHLRGLLLFFAGAWRTSFAETAAAREQNTKIKKLLSSSGNALTTNGGGKPRNDPLTQITKLLLSDMTGRGTVPSYHLLTRLLDHAIHAVREARQQHGTPTSASAHSRWGLQVFLLFAPYTSVTGDMVEQVLMLLWLSSAFPAQEADTALFQDALRSVLQHFQSVRLTPCGVACVVLLYAHAAEQNDAHLRNLLLWRAVSEAHRLNEIERAGAMDLIHTYCRGQNSANGPRAQEVLRCLLNGCMQFLLHHPHHDAAADQMFFAVADRLYKQTATGKPERGRTHTRFIEELLERLMRKDAAGASEPGGVTPWGRTMLFYRMYKEDETAVGAAASAESARFHLRVVSYLLERDCAHQREARVALSGSRAKDAFCGWQEALRVVGPLLAQGSARKEVLPEMNQNDTLLCETAGKTLDALCLARPHHCWKEALLLCSSLALGDRAPVVGGSNNTGEAVSSLASPRAPLMYSAMQYLLSQQDLCALPLDVSTSLLKALYAVEQHESAYFHTLNSDKQKNRLRLIKAFSLVIANHPFMTMEAAKAISGQLQFLESRLQEAGSDSREESVFGAFSAQYVERLCGSCQYEEALCAAVSLPLAATGKGLVAQLKHAAACVAPFHIDEVMRLVQEAAAGPHGESSPADASSMRAQQLTSLLRLNKPQVNDQLAREFAECLLAGHTQRAAEMCRGCPSLLSCAPLLQPPGAAAIPATTAAALVATTRDRRESRLHFRTVGNFFTSLARPSHVAAPTPSFAPQSPSIAGFQWTSLLSSSSEQLAWVVDCYARCIRTHLTATPSQQRHLRATLEAAVGANLALWSALLEQNSLGDGAHGETLPLLLHLSEWITAYAFHCDRPLDSDNVFSAPWMRLYAAPDSASLLAALVQQIEKQLLPAIVKLLGKAVPREEGKDGGAPRRSWLRVTGMESQWRRLVMVAAAALPEADVAAQLAVHLSQLAMAEGASGGAGGSGTRLFAPQEIRFLKQVHAQWAEAVPPLHALAERRDAESVLQWRDAAFQRSECPPLMLSLVMIESIRLLRSMGATGQGVSPLTGIRMSALIRYSESLTAMKSVPFFAEGAQHFLALLAREEAKRGTNVVLPFAWIEAARLFVAVAPRTLKRARAHLCTNDEDGDYGESKSEENGSSSESAEEAKELQCLSQLACEVYAQWQAMNELDHAAGGARVDMAVDSSYEQAFCLELMQLLAYTQQPVTSQGEVGTLPSASKAKERSTPNVKKIFAALLNQCTAQPSTLTHEKYVALFNCLNSFLRRSHTCMAAAAAAAAAAEVSAARAPQNKQTDGFEKLTLFCEESVELTLFVWKKVNAAWREVVQYSDATRHRNTNDGEAAVYKCQEQIVFHLLQIQALRATQGQDPCPSFRHVLNTMRAAVPVHLNDDVKALLKLNCIRFHKAGWKKMYASITNTSPRLTMRESTLTGEEEVAERQRLSRALLSAPSCEAAWALCQAKREAGVRLSREHYKEVLRRLERDAQEAVAEPRKSTGSFSCAAGRWRLVEDLFFALLRDGVTPDVASIEQIFSLLRCTQASADASEARDSAQSCLYFAKMLTLLPPITNTRHTGKAVRQRTTEREQAEATDKGDYMLTTSILNSVFSSSQYMAQALLGSGSSKMDEAEAEDALATLQDTCELTASFTVWINEFSRVPRMSQDTIEHLVFLFCHSFHVTHGGADKGGGYHIASQGASELMRSAFEIVKNERASSFVDRRAACTANRPLHAKAALLCVSKQKQLHHAVPSFFSLGHLCSAAMALDEPSSYHHTLQQLAGLVRDPAAVTAAERAALALRVAEQSLWSLAKGQQPKESIISAAEIRICVENAYAATLALFTPDTSKLYNDIVMDKAPTSVMATRDEEKGERKQQEEEGEALSLETRQIESHIDSLMHDVAGELSFSRAAALSPHEAPPLPLPPALLESISTLNDLVTRTEPTADFNIALRHVVKELCECQAWRSAAAWVEAAIQTSWPLPQRERATTDTGSPSTPPRLFIDINTAEAGPAHPAAVAARAAVDDFLLFDIHLALLRAEKNGKVRGTPTSLELLQEESRGKRELASELPADAKLLDKIVKDVLFSRAGRRESSVVHDAIRLEMEKM